MLAQVLAEGSAVPRSSIFISCDCGPHSTLQGGGVVLALSVCVAGRGARRGQGAASEEGQEQLPRSDTPPSRQDLGLISRRSGQCLRLPHACLLPESAPSPLAPPPRDPGAPSGAGLWRVCEHRFLLPWTLALHCWKWV